MASSPQPHKGPSHLPVRLLPGGLALVDFTSPESADLAGDLPRVLEELQRLIDASVTEGRIQAVQCFLRPEQTQLAQALDRQLDFHQAALLDYLTASALPAPPRADDGDTARGQPSCRFVPARSREGLIPIVAETYAESADCGQIEPPQTVAETLAGYETIGQSGRRLWFTIETVGTPGPPEPAGCLLLADHGPGCPVELVYVGIVPRFRRRGFGRRAVRHARLVAAERCRTAVIVAVDRANRPARSVYAAEGYRPVATQAVWFWKRPERAP